MERMTEEMHDERQKHGMEPFVMKISSSKCKVKEEEELPPMNE